MNNLSISEGTESLPSVWCYDKIDTLVIPESLDIPHSDYNSPFASYEQRPFVWNYPTKWSGVRIGKIENHSPYLAVKDGVLYSADMTRLIYCFEERERFVVPDTVTTIEPYAFCLQKRLKSIMLHDGITFIGDAVFMACQSLREVTVPSKVKVIRADTFDGCSALSRVHLSEGLEGIGHCAFRQCRALKSIRLPETLKYVCGFEGCSALREIEIPAGVERIRGFMFCDSLRKVLLHKGVKRIDGYAFRYCNNLKDINFPDGLEYIGERAFYHNSRLRYVEFKSNVTNIDQAAFACCPLLFKKFIRKPDDMEIKDNAFIEDPGLDKYGFWD